MGARSAAHLCARLEFVGVWTTGRRRFLAAVSRRKWRARALITCRHRRRPLAAARGSGAAWFDWRARAVRPAQSKAGAALAQSLELAPIGASWLAAAFRAKPLPLAPSESWRRASWRPGGPPAPRPAPGQQADAEQDRRQWRGMGGSAHGANGANGRRGQGPACGAQAEHANASTGRPGAASTVMQTDGGRSPAATELGRHYRGRRICPPPPPPPLGWARHVSTIIETYFGHICVLGAV